VGHSDEPGHIDLLVKQYPNGKASTHLHSMKPGDRLYFLAALKGHNWVPNKYPHVTMIAGGAGITPMFQLIQGILSNSEDKTRITLVFGVNTDADALFKLQFEDFERIYPGRFKAIYTVSNPIKDSQFRKGYVTKELLQEVIPAKEGKDTMIFVCGPPAMEAALTGKQAGILKQLGYNKEQICKM